jgi:hypothetical protein
MYNSLFIAMITILVFTTLTSNAFAHVSAQQRYDDGYYAAKTMQSVTILSDVLNLLILTE